MRVGYWSTNYTPKPFHPIGLNSRNHKKNKTGFSKKIKTFFRVDLKN